MRNYVASSMDSKVCLLLLLCIIVTIGESDGRNILQCNYPITVICQDPEHSVFCNREDICQQVRTVIHPDIDDSSIAIEVQEQGLFKDMQKNE